MRALVINGPNLNLLGRREPDVYGSTTYAQLVEKIIEWGRQLNLEVECFQSNHEGELLDKIQAAEVDFLVLNPGAYTHTSIALRDCLVGVGIPAIEVHLSNVHAREEFRHRSFISPVVRGVICGLGILGYRLALEAGVGGLSRPSCELHGPDE